MRQIQIPDHGQLERLLRPHLRSRPAGHHPFRRQRAGKSTTMAAFIAALIPDQSLLHFRNTTEAGSSSASRDKGALRQAAKRGHCYSLLEVMNSREQRIWVGVHLEQVANRDNKVNITPFALVDVPEHQTHGSAAAGETRRRQGPGARLYRSEGRQPELGASRSPSSIR